MQKLPVHILHALTNRSIFYNSRLISSIINDIGIDLNIDSLATGVSVVSLSHFQYRDLAKNERA